MRAKNKKEINIAEAAIEIERQEEEKIQKFVKYKKNQVKKGFIKEYDETVIDKAEFNAFLKNLERFPHIRETVDKKEDSEEEVVKDVREEEKINKLDVSNYDDREEQLNLIEYGQIERMRHRGARTQKQKRELEEKLEQLDKIGNQKAANKHGMLNRLNIDQEKFAKMHKSVQE